MTIPLPQIKQYNYCLVKQQGKIKICQISKLHPRSVRAQDLQNFNEFVLPRRRYTPYWLQEGDLFFYTPGNQYLRVESLWYHAVEGIIAKMHDYKTGDFTGNVHVDVLSDEKLYTLVPNG